MASKLTIFLLCATTFGTTLSHTVPPTEHFNNSVFLDAERKYQLFWNFNATHIVFEVHVETTGYVGFGISPNGKMVQSDVILCWVKDGVTHFSDRHTDAWATPKIDQSQDWFLLHGEEADQITILKFVRRLDTCDPDDKVIDDQTVRLIYSYHPDDPTSDTNITYHGVKRRGTKTLSLLRTSLPPSSYKPGDDDTKVFEFRTRNYAVPAKDTTYACTAFEMPDLGGKHHMVEFEPIFTPGNEHHVHHITIMRCDGSHPELDMAVEECMGPFPRGWPSCPEIFAGWGTGGGPFYFPEEAGFPVGGHFPSFYVMQTHYDNPTNKTGIIDSSGIRIRMTSKLRKHDVGSVNLGAIVTNYQVIPPGEKAFVSRGYCGSECITQAMDRSNLPEFKIIAGFLHAHLLASRITTRHFRNGTELEPLADDPYYDISVQEMRPYTPRTVLSGDSFIVECTYDSLGRNVPTFGGFSTREEMCTNCLYIYPDIHILACQSMPVFDTYTEKGAALHHKFLTMNWDDQNARTDFYRKLDNSTVYHQCVSNVNGKMAVGNHYYREHTKPFVPRTTQPNCH